MWILWIVIIVLFLLLVLKGEARDNFLGMLGCSVMGVFQLIMAAIPIVIAIMILAWIFG